MRYTSGTTPTSYQYTGQRNDTAIGLYFYNARYYDPALGRFIQADSIVPGAASGSGGGATTLGYDSKTRLTPLTVNLGEFAAQVSAENREVLQFGAFFQWDSKVRQEHNVPMGPANPQALNRYAYCLNNPLRYVDPTGHWSRTYSRNQIQDLSGIARDFKLFMGDVGTGLAILGGVGAAVSLFTGFGPGVGLGAVCFALGTELFAVEASTLEYLENYLAEAYETAERLNLSDVTVYTYVSEEDPLYLSIYVEGMEHAISITGCSAFYGALITQAPEGAIELLGNYSQVEWR